MEPTNRRKTGYPTEPRCLRIEPLESRTLLSAAPFAPTGADPASFAAPRPLPPSVPPPVAEYGAALQQRFTFSTDNIDSPSLPAAVPQDAGDRLRILRHTDQSFSTSETSVPITNTAPWSALAFGPTASASTSQPGRGFAPVPIGDPNPTLLSLPERDAVLPGDHNQSDLPPRHTAIGGAHDSIKLEPPAWPPSLGNPSTIAGNPPFHAGNERLDPIRVLTDFYSDHDESQASLAASVGGIAGSLKHGTLQTSPHESVGDAGLIDLATYSLFGLIDASTTRSIWTEMVPSQTTASNSSDPASGTVFSTTVASDSELPEGVGTSDPGDWSEGGFIDVGRSLSTSDAEESGALPSWLRSPLSLSVEEDVVGLLRRRFRDRATDSEQADSSEQEDEPQPNDTPQAEQAVEESAPVASVASQSTEGGMIELVAATEASCQASRTADPAAKAVRGNAENIRIDRGLGLYRAFELATTRSEPVAASESTWNGQNAASADSRSNLTSAAADTPAAETSAAAQAAQHHAAAAPAILIVLLASRSAGTSKQRERLTENTNGLHRSPSHG